MTFHADGASGRTRMAAADGAGRTNEDRATFAVRFWGARGTLASNAEDTARYGGNTACVEIVLGDERLIFDAGSGLRALGDAIMAQSAAAREAGEALKPVHLLFTHCHYDHISGLPFFAPFFDPGQDITLWSGHLAGPDKTRKMIADYMAPPFFPVGPEVFSAKLNYRDFEPGDALEPLPGVEVSTLALNHHNGCVGYRVDFEGRSVCYITDTTHIPGEPDEGILDFVRGCDLMIYDGTYTDAEFPRFWNFGHSTWEEGVRLCEAADVARYAIFHHRPSRTDDAMAAIEKECRAMFPQSWAAREGLTIEL